MKVLIIGSGGREHAIAYTIAKSSNVTEIFVAPGNAGTALESKTTNIAINETDINSLITFAKNNNIALTIVGPELPLSLGIVDEFTKHNLKIFGPTKASAQLESSKAFAKEFMIKNNIPTAQYKEFNNASLAIQYLDDIEPPYVIKADGLAAGKGVIIASDKPTAINAINDILLNNKFNLTDNKIIIEEFLTGWEASFIAIVAGDKVLPLASSKDHKALLENDKGPNTGGMGAFSPSNHINDALFDKITTEVMQVAANALCQQGTPYYGFLYAGLMLNENGYKVLEFNCRLGDPETQAILMRLKSDLADVCLAALNNSLATVDLQWDDRVALNVVLAAHGYPEKYQKGEIISGLNDSSDIKIFHAGTKQYQDKILTNGGRVLAVTALAPNLNSARDKVYQKISSISFDRMQFRKDIGG